MFSLCTVCILNLSSVLYVNQRAWHCIAVKNLFSVTHSPISRVRKVKVRPKLSSCLHLDYMKQTGRSRQTCLFCSFLLKPTTKPTQFTVIGQSASCPCGYQTMVTPEAVLYRPACPSSLVVAHSSTTKCPVQHPEKCFTHL